MGHGHAILAVRRLGEDGKLHINYDRYGISRLKRGDLVNVLTGEKRIEGMTRATLYVGGRGVGSLVTMEGTDEKLLASFYDWGTGFFDNINPEHLLDVLGHMPDSIEDTDTAQAYALDALGVRLSEWEAKKLTSAIAMRKSGFLPGNLIELFAVNYVLYTSRADERIEVEVLSPASNKPVRIEVGVFYVVARIGCKPFLFKGKEEAELLRPIFLSGDFISIASHLLCLHEQIKAQLGEAFK